MDSKAVGVSEVPLLPVTPEAPSLELLWGLQCQPHRGVSPCCC
jgi:hypothetical protein